MTRTRTDAVIVRPTNNIYTALTGSACVALLIALVLMWLRYNAVTGGRALFFGLF